MSDLQKSPLKHCNRCGLDKPLSDFSYSSKGAGKGKRYSHHCKACIAAKQRIRTRGTAEYCVRVKRQPSELKAAIKAKRLQTIRFLNDAKRCGCQICGYKKCLAALEFHHASGDKKFILSKAKGFSLGRIRSELKKCMVVCANCHREIHSKNEESLFLLKAS